MCICHRADDVPVVLDAKQFHRRCSSHVHLAENAAAVYESVIYFVWITERACDCACVINA